MKTKPVISIVDDDESCREAIAGLINWLGFGVQTFTSAIEFLSSPDAADSSCVITDVQMPQMTGRGGRISAENKLACEAAHTWLSEKQWRMAVCAIRPDK